MSLFDNGLPDTCAKCGRQLVDSTICLFCGKNHGPIPDGAQLRDEAIRQVEENADDEAKAAFERSVLALQAGKQFTSEAVLRALDRNGYSSHEPRFAGAIMRKLARAGAIRKTGHYTESKNPRAHARPIMVWERT